METTAAFAGLSCTDCGETFDAASAPGRCPDCGGALDPAYDYDALDVNRETLAGDRPGIWRYEQLLPFTRSSATTMDEGETPLVNCPRLADELGVERVLVKDEGRNPTGAFEDRGQALAVTAADQHGATDVALPTAGDAGQAAAAYAARAGLNSHAFVPTRSSFVNKAMINVHGGDMSVVEGRIDDAEAAFEGALDDNDGWHSVAAFTTPYRHEGKKTVYYETVEQLDWDVPDRVVVATGYGDGVVGVDKAATELNELGLVDDRPAIYAAQAEGCAPIVEAFENGADAHEPWDVPDTICGGIEVPDPDGSPLVLDALRDSDGGAVATSDADILDSTVTVAQHEGIEMGVDSAAAASGAWQLAQNGEFDGDDTVVLLNAGSGSKDADVVRSHLMSKGL